MQEADPRGEEFNATPLRCSKQPVAGLVCLASKAGRTLRDLWPLSIEKVVVKEPAENI